MALVPDSTGMIIVNLRDASEPVTVSSGFWVALHERPPIRGVPRWRKQNGGRFSTRWAQACPMRKNHCGVAGAETNSRDITARPRLIEAQIGEKWIPLFRIETQLPWETLLINDLPDHGRVACSLCFHDQSIEFDRSKDRWVGPSLQI
jgi:hypothetical protein